MTDTFWATLQNTLTISEPVSKKYFAASRKDDKKYHYLKNCLLSHLCTAGNNEIDTIKQCLDNINGTTFHPELIVELKVSPLSNLVEIASDKLSKEILLLIDNLLSSITEVRTQANKENKNPNSEKGIDAKKPSYFTEISKFIYKFFTVLIEHDRLVSSNTNLLLTFICRIAQVAEQIPFIFTQWSEFNCSIEPDMSFFQHSCGLFKKVPMNVDTFFPSVELLKGNMFGPSSVFTEIARSGFESLFIMANNEKEFYKWTLLIDYSTIVLSTLLSYFQLTVRQDNLYDLMHNYIKGDKLRPKKTLENLWGSLNTFEYFYRLLCSSKYSELQILFTDKFRRLVRSVCNNSIETDCKVLFCLILIHNIIKGGSKNAGFHHLIYESRKGLFSLLFQKIFENVDNHEYFSNSQFKTFEICVMKFLSTFEIECKIYFGESAAMQIKKQVRTICSELEITETEIEQEFRLTGSIVMTKVGQNRSFDRFTLKKLVNYFANEPEFNRYLNEFVDKNLFAITSLSTILSIHFESYKMLQVLNNSNVKDKIKFSADDVDIYSRFSLECDQNVTAELASLCHLQENFGYSRRLFSKVYVKCALTYIMST